MKIPTLKTFSCSPLTYKLRYMPLIHCLLLLCITGCLQRAAQQNIEPLTEVVSCSHLEPALRVSFFDVGQGDAILIRCPDGITQTLIDAGEFNFRYPDAEPLFLNALKSRMNDSIIELAVNTHPHSDHLAGFISILSDEASKYSIKKFIDNGLDNPNSESEEQIRELIVEQGGEYLDISLSKQLQIEICPGDDFEKGGKSKNFNDQIKLEILHPDSKMEKQLRCPENLNDCSIVSKLTMGRYSFLFLGDATSRWELLALKSFGSRLENADVIKAGHHGSSSTTSAFLEKVRPKAVILSTGAPGMGTTGTFSFPELDVIDRLGDFFSSKESRRAGLESTITQSYPLMGCRRERGICIWEQRIIDANILSTAALGTIDVYISRSSDEKICVEANSRSIGMN